MDLNINDYIKSIKAQGAPFGCPKCEKQYKSIIGIQYHLSNYNHDNPTTPLTHVPAKSRLTSNKKKKKIAGTPKNQPPISNPQPQEVVSFDELNKEILFKFSGNTVLLPINEEIPVIGLDVYEKMTSHSNYEFAAIETLPEMPEIKLPEAVFKEISYNICDAQPKPNAYIRFIEKSTEELDGEIEYDVDEEDTTWLAIINEKRDLMSLNAVSVDSLELLIDRLEKESFFQALANGNGQGVAVDEDAVCCICMDGECQNTNVILFCDLCDLAVHQDCFGVPYIPEGQWLCRRCLQSPSRPVECVLCPNSGGAFKQTDQTGKWAHVVCALWIPEVRFANTVFLEPIDSIEMIPPARWRLTCYICKQKGVGACIQCNKNYCYSAFHVTCAQYAGLCMRMETVKLNDTHPMVVQKIAFCDQHTPSNFGAEKSPVECEKAREECRNKMKQARKLLAKRRTIAPLILVPTIPQDRIQEISALVNIQKKSNFIQRLIAYWTLKRQNRNGVPLLRRLQSSQSSGNRNNGGFEGSPDMRELFRQLNYWKSLRQDLERARLLCELVRKREKLKLLLIKTTEECVLKELNPLGNSMSHILDQIVSKDTLEIFQEPVDCSEVPDYANVIKHPIDLGTMREKLQAGKYETLDDLEADFALMVRNCLLYNDKDTIFYKAGVKMKEQGGAVFRQSRRELEKVGLVEPPQSDSNIVKDIDQDLKVLLLKPPQTELIEQMELLINRANSIKHGLTKAKKLKQLKSEIGKIRRYISFESKKSQDDSQSDGGESKTSLSIISEVAVKAPLLDLKTPPTSPIKGFNTTSPNSSVGVNRRTAVLFTRKAQSAALKRPDLLLKEEESLDVQEQSKIDSPIQKLPKKMSRGRRSASHKSAESKKSSLLSPKVSHSGLSLDPPKFDAKIPDIFRQYRGQESKKTLSNSDNSDFNDSNSTCSSCCLGLSESCSSSEFGSSDQLSNIDSEMGSVNSGSATIANQDDDSQRSVKNDDDLDESNDSEIATNSSKKKQKLSPLQLVWAKCRGYPAYPALIMDPDIKNFQTHNSVPLPTPPNRVLALRKNHLDTVFLVLFFDAKRTWQWLPPSKLELLGIDKQTDEMKLVESRKPQERKAVKKAYQEALHYQSQVSSAKPEGKL